jgi:CHAT domain-containing protein/tetratricopeptide (TPR) repeat protein
MTSDHVWPRTADEFWARLDVALSGETDVAVTELRALLTAVPSGTDPRIHVTLLRALASVLSRARQRARADNLEEAIALLHRARELVPGLASLSSEVAHDLGDLYLLRLTGKREDNLRHAETLADEAGRAVSKLGDPEQWAASRGLAGRCALAWANIGTDQKRSADVERAIVFFRQGVQALESLPKKGDWVLLRADLARAYLERVAGGRPDNVEAALQCCCATIDGMDDDIDAHSRSRVLQQRGLTYAQRHYGDRRENLHLARADLIEALRFRQPGTESWAATKTNLGNILAMLGDHRAAIDEYELALTVRTAADFPEGWADTVDSLATAEIERKDGDRPANLLRALSLLSRLLEVRSALGQSLSYARTLEKIGTLHRRLAEIDPDRRPDHLRRAAAAMSGAMDVLPSLDAPADAFHVATRMAAMHAGQGNWVRAAAAYRLVITYLEQLYESAVLDRAQEQELAASDGLTREAAYVFARVGALREAVEVLERFRARRLGELLARDRAELSILASEHPQLVERWSAVVKALRVAETQALTHTPSAGGVPTSDPIDLSGSADRVASLRVELGRVVTAIREIPHHEQFLAPPGLADVTTVVQLHRPLAYLVTIHAGSVVLVVSTSTDNELQFEVLWAHGLTTTELAQVLPSVVGNRQPRSGTMETKEVSGLEGLGNELARPLAAHLAMKGASAVLLIPCGLLGALPIHAAPYRKPNGSSMHLIEQVVVHFAPSARAFSAAARALARAGGRPLSYLGVGNPATMRARRLPCAEAEVKEAVAALPSDAASDLLLGPDATRQNVLRRLPGPVLLHLACHGLADSDDPMSSRLLLAGDDVLTARDLTTAPVIGGAATLLGDVRLVVATACQSAVVDTVRVPDEVVGLPTSFLLAGACAVIGTLWSVDDRSTSILVTKFWELLFQSGSPKQAAEPAKALAAAQTWLRTMTAAELVSFVSRHPYLAASIGPLLDRARAQPEERPFRAVSHWGSFVYVGV